MFTDRRVAGRALGEMLQEFHDQLVVVLGLPRGGVPVAFEVAKALDAPLDVIVVRKLGVPGHEELAFGAVASGGIRVLNEEVIWQLRLDSDIVDEVTRNELEEVGRQESAFRGTRGPIEIQHQAVILVDDGLATGATMRARREP